MILITVVSDRNGMMFNHRRLSRDRILNEKILSITQNGKLWMSSYSAKIFQGMDGAERIITDDDFLQKARDGDYCFTENVLPDIKEIEKIILFCWNRNYPADVYFNIDLSSWKLVKTEDFSGNSHDKITMGKYISEKA